MMSYRHSALTSLNTFFIQISPMLFHLLAQRSPSPLATMCHSIFTTQYRSKVYNNHIHSKNVKYHDDSTNDFK